MLPVIVTNTDKFRNCVEGYPWALYIRLHNARETILPVSLLLIGSGCKPRYLQISKLLWTMESDVLEKFDPHPILSISDTQSVPARLKSQSAL